MTRHYARTFYFASHCLPRTTRRHAYALYGFCRWADNSVDEARDVEEAKARLDAVRVALDAAYSDRPAAAALLAFRETIQERLVPRKLFEDLLLGMEMDLTIDRYPSFAELDVYCYRVAGVVGLMMTHLFGFRDERCFPHAVALGRAMQLTNILRDVGEDLARGRVYLPLDELDQYGVSIEQLKAGVVDDSFRRLMRFQIDRARAAYAEAELGVPWLVGATHRLTVRVMARIYGGILNEIERNDDNVFGRRARVSTGRKLRLLARCEAATARESIRRFLS